ncbi:MAG: hypothetical protein IIA67_02055 [Planctomycetes bacterium]|nr:hypothetical protein [Planctomycetota bacterium]
MTWCNTAIRLSRLAAFCVLCGCGDSADESADNGESENEKQSISIANKTDPATVPPSELSATIKPYSVEDHTLEIFVPLGWDMQRSRASEYLVRFTVGRYNSITVRKSEKYSALQDVAEENQTQFVEQIQKALDEELKNPEALVQKVAPITLPGIAPEGEPANPRPFIGAHYILRVTAKKKNGTPLNLDQLVLVTVVGGRKYTVQLRTHVKLIHEKRPAAHAVAAGMKFHNTPMKKAADDAGKKADEKTGADEGEKPAP